MKILITGSSGFLGKTLKESFKEEKVFDLNRNSGNYCCKLEKDMPEFNEVFDLVIHAAGKAHCIPKTEIEEQSFFDVNVLGTNNLLKGLKKTGVPKQFIFISSVSVYGLEFGKLIKEESSLLAKDPYGRSKIDAERKIQEWCKTNNVICTILRLPLLVGLGAPGNLGAMIKSIKGGYYFNIAGGKAKKSMVLIDDIANFIPNVTSKGGIYNLSDGLNPDFKTLSSAISFSLNKGKILNLPFAVAKVMGVIGDLLGSKAPINSLKIKKITSELTFDDSKARESLNWNPRSVIDYIKKFGV